MEVSGFSQGINLDLKWRQIEPSIVPLQILCHVCQAIVNILILRHNISNEYWESLNEMQEIMKSFSNVW